MTAHRTIICRTALAATTAVAALVLTACSDGAGGGHDMGSMESDSSPTATATTSAKPGDHSAADVSFSTEMIRHHRQAIEMAELADSHASSQQIKDLATKIKGEQDPEIKTMSGWLTSWGEAVPEDMSGMEHDTSSAMPGMMSSDDMDKLKRASGGDFDAMFLTMMVQHHEGAIEMAKIERANGTYAPAKKLADTVVTAQSAEIEQMKQMLDKS
jgi:uncharacterized protein (DUF305 family)